MPPPVSTSTDQASAPISCGVQSSRNDSKASANGSVTTIEASELHHLPGAQVELRAEPLLVSVPAVMASRASMVSPSVSGVMPRGGEPARHDEGDPGEAEQQPDDLEPAQPLAQQPGERRGEHRLQVHHQRGDAGRHPGGDRRPDPAEVAGLDPDPGHRDVQPPRARVATAPAPASGQRQHQHDDARVAHHQEAQRLGVRRGVLGDHEPGRPDHHESAGVARTASDAGVVVAMPGP